MSLSRIVATLIVSMMRKKIYVIVALMVVVGGILWWLDYRWGIFGDVMTDRDLVNRGMDAVESGDDNARTAIVEDIRSQRAYIKSPEYLYVLAVIEMKNGNSDIADKYIDYLSKLDVERISLRDGITITKSEVVEALRRDVEFEQKFKSELDATHQQTLKYREGG